MSIEKTMQQIKNEQVRLNKTLEFNEFFKNFNMKTFIEPEYNKLILCSKNTETPIINVPYNVIDNTPYILEKLTIFKPIFESIKNFINDISYGNIYLDSNKVTFIYKNTILVKIHPINENTLEIESNFKIEKSSCHIQFNKSEGKLIISAGFTSKEDITYDIEKQITPQKFNATILDEMNKETIRIFQENLNIDVKTYPQSKYTFWD